MTKTVNAKFTGDVNNGQVGSEIKLSWWERTRNAVVEAADTVGVTTVKYVKEAYEATAEYTDKTVKPFVIETARTGCERLDAGCMVASKAAVDFLVEYPGIAMVLSPGTVVKMAVAQHVENMTGRSVDNKRVVVNSSEHDGE